MRFNYIACSILASVFPLSSAAGVQWAGVNIAGFDFGCGTDGTCTLSAVTPPLPPNGQDGPGQMQHFATADKLNIFRLPVAWQYLVNNQLGGPLDDGNFGKYDTLMQGCLKTGAHCIIDIHNYARWNGQIIGQGTDPKAFADLWSRLAGKYKGEPNVIMGLVNEPHDMPDLTGWASAVQGAVNAIRQAGATTQIILIPGNGYTGASTLVSGGSASALAAITDPAGGTDKLLFDAHQYFDSDSSGTGSTCVSNKISDAFQPLAAWMRQNKRRVLVSELGGSSDPSCLTNVCTALDFLNQNSDVFAGYVGWAAGSFSPTYVLSLAPQGSTDVPLMSQCIAGKFQGGSGGSGGSTNTTTTPTTPGNTGGGTTGGGSGVSGSGTSNSTSTAPTGTTTCRPGRRSRRRRNEVAEKLITT